MVDGGVSWQKAPSLHGDFGKGPPARMVRGVYRECGVARRRRRRLGVLARRTVSTALSEASRERDHAHMTYCRLL